MQDNEPTAVGLIGDDIMQAAREMAIERAKAEETAPLPVPDFHSHKQKAAFIGKLESKINALTDRPVELAYSNGVDDAHSAIVGYAKYQRRLAMQALVAAEGSFEDGQACFAQGECSALDRVLAFILAREENIAKRKGVSDE